MRWIGKQERVTNTNRSFPVTSLNIVTQNRRGWLTRIISRCYHFFDVIRVVDGGSVDGTVEACENDGKITLFQNRWNNDLSAQFNILLNAATDGEWMLTLADDELPTIYFLENLYEIILECELTGCNIIGIPMYVVMDGVPEIDTLEYIGQARGHGMGDGEKFRAWRLFKYKSGLKFVGTTHCGVDETAINAVRYLTEYPIEHLKKPAGFIQGNLWPCIVNPRGHGYSASEAKSLQYALSESRIYDPKCLHERFVDGNIGNKLKEFMWEYKDKLDGPQSNWWMIYYLEYHPEELGPEFQFYQEDAVIHYVRHVLGLSFNKWDMVWIRRTTLHPYIKTWLINRGIDAVYSKQMDNLKEVWGGACLLEGTTR